MGRTYLILIGFCEQAGTDSEAVTG